MATNYDKKALTICMIGHVDSGKSTLTATTFVCLGKVSAREQAKSKNEAVQRGKDSFEKAFLLDCLKEERDRGITITAKSKMVSMSDYPNFQFSSEIQKELNHDIVLYFFDCPGHRDFVKSMIGGASRSNVAVVVIPAPDFESAVCMEGTTQLHTLIAGIFGVKKLILGVNKLDFYNTPEKQQEVFKNISDEMKTNVIPALHPDRSPIIIPLSALHEINICESSKKFPWWKGTTGGGRDPANNHVVTLMDAIFSIPLPVRNHDASLRIIVTDQCTVSGIGTVFAAFVHAGMLTVGMELNVLALDAKYVVKSLQIHHTDAPCAMAGEAVGITFKSMAKDVCSKINAGHAFCPANDTTAKMYPVFVAKLLLHDHKNGIKPGYAPTLDIATVCVPVRLIAILDKKKMASKAAPQPLAEGEKLQSKELGTCVFYPLKPIYFETDKETASLSKFALRDGGCIVGFGRIIEKLTLQQAAERGYQVDIGKKASAKKEGKTKK